MRWNKNTFQLFLGLLFLGLFVISIIILIAYILDLII